MANIFQQYAQPARSVMDYQADYDNKDLRREQLGAARRTNEIADLTATQTRQTMAESASERNILRQLAARYGGDEQGFIRALGASGSPGLMDMAGKREKSALDRGKLTADTAKTDAETKALQAKAKYDAADRLAQKIAMVNTPDDLQAYEAEGIGLGIFPAERRGYSLQQAQELGGIEQWKAASAKAAVPVLDRFKADADMARSRLTADTSILTTGMTNATSRETNAATQATALAGQRSVAATAAAARDQSASQFKTTQEAGRWTYDSERGGQVNTQSGEFRPATQGGVPLGPKDQVTTEGERKAATLLQRMRFSANQIVELTSGAAGAGMDTPDKLAAALSVLPVVGNVTSRSANPQSRRIIEDAQLDVLDAALTLGTGAAYTREQLEGYRKSYFPQVGDTPVDAKSKRERLANVLKAGETQAGRAAKSVPQFEPKAAASPPATKGVKFLGFE